MILKNLSCCPVFITESNSSYTLNTNECITLDASNGITIKLSHFYCSRVETAKKLLLADMDTSVVSLLGAWETPAPFQLVMDTVFTVSPLLDEDVLYIRRQRLRASVECTYDRFYLECEPNKIQSVQHIIKEKEEYLKQHQTASSKGTQLLCGIALAVVLTLGLGLTLLAIFASANVLIAIMIGIVVISILALPVAIVYVVCKLLNKISHKSFAENFDNNVIIHKFEKAFSKEDTTCIVD